MKIILVTPLLDHGGGQRYVTNLANYWASMNHDVTIVLMRSGTSFFALSNTIKVIELNYSNKNTIIKFISGLKAVIKLRRFVKREKPNFVLSILSSTNIFTLISTKFLTVRVIVRDAMSPYIKRNKIEIYLRKLLYKKATGVILMTESAKDFVKVETGVKNVCVIPNPVSHVTKINEIKKEKIVINVGRLISVKGQEYFLEACAKINRPDWKFVILGDGERRERLKNKVKALGLTNNVIMAGAVENIEVWLNKSSIFVSTSLSEAWGNAICEAMQVGLPVVCFNCDVSPKEIIDDEINGFLVPVGDLDKLSQKIEMLMDNELLRDEIGNNAMRKTKEFDIKSISDQVLNFCSE